ncbi:hypothetical protein L0244_38730 [bacterium]|nr:hypothetical protein [bacterium]
MPCCSVTNGLGQFDPATLLAINSAFVHAKDIWNDILKIFGIGAGAREADAIVPLQNELVNGIIAPVSDFLTQINNGTLKPTCTELQTWQREVLAAEKRWMDFLHNTQWQDGRAAQQAEATLLPYWTNAKRDLAKYVQQYCGTLGGGVLTTSEGDINWPIVALVGGAVFMLMRRK